MWGGPAGDNWDIYVKALGVGTKPLRLTENPADDMGPAWSPDGKHVAFVRVSEKGGAIYTVPWPSGQERRLIDHDVDVTGSSSKLYPALSWSPDGRWLAFHERTPGELGQPHRPRLAGHREKQASHGSAGEHPGRHVSGVLARRGVAGLRAVERADFGAWDVWVQPVKGGEPRRLTSAPIRCRSRPDLDARRRERSSTRRAADSSIEGVSVAGGEPRLLLGIGAPSRRSAGTCWCTCRSLPRRGSSGAWRAAERASQPGTGEADRLQPGGGQPAYSPDGRRIAFESGRSGVSNIWLCDSDGRNAVQLTSFERSAGTPRWSPDGRRLAFDSLEAGDRNIYVVDADGGAPRRLTQEPSQEHAGTGPGMAGGSTSSRIEAAAGRSGRCSPLEVLRSR